MAHCDNLVNLLLWILIKILLWILILSATLVSILPFINSLCRDHLQVLNFTAAQILRVRINVGDDLIPFPVWFLIPFNWLPLKAAYSIFRYFDSSSCRDNPLATLVASYMGQSSALEAFSTKPLLFLWRTAFLVFEDRLQL